MKSLVLFVCVASMVLFAGCNRGPTKYKVSGTVKMDNKPLESGQMTFNPADKGVPGEGASIKNGAYSVEIAAGKFSVQIDARKKVPLAKGEAAGTPGETDKLVPIEFQEGNLPLEVSGPATKDFDLTSKK